MFSFFRKKSQEPEPVSVPEWADFFTPEEYAAFLAEIHHYFDGIDATCSEDVGTIEAEHASLGSVHLGLLNVAQICKQNAQNDYGSIISGHFDAMFRALEFDSAFEKEISDFEKVKPYLAVRLYDAEYMACIKVPDEKEGRTPICRFVADDIYATLVFDLPNSIRNVAYGDVDAWGMDEETLFRIGIANVRANNPMHITREDMGGVDIWFVNNDHFFTANIIYELEDRPELLGNWGSLIALPHRHSAIIYPVEDPGVAEALRKIIPAAYSMYQDGPGSLTPNVFWYKDGDFTLLPYELRGEKLHLIPPDKFLDMLSELEKRLH